jgi:hypothetical protein
MSIRSPRASPEDRSVRPASTSRTTPPRATSTSRSRRSTKTTRTPSRHTSRCPKKAATGSSSQTEPKAAASPLPQRRQAHLHLQLLRAQNHHDNSPDRCLPAQQPSASTLPTMVEASAKVDLPCLLQQSICRQSPNQTNRPDGLLFRGHFRHGEDSATRRRLPKPFPLYRHHRPHQLRHLKVTYHSIPTSLPQKSPIPELSYFVFESLPAARRQSCDLPGVRESETKESNRLIGARATALRKVAFCS